MPWFKFWRRARNNDDNFQRDPANARDYYLGRNLRPRRDSLAEEGNPMSLWTLAKHFLALRSLIVPLLAIFLPLDLVVFGRSEESRCGYVILLMAILWLTEAIPIPATSLIPIFAFPLLGLAEASVVSASYFTDTSMLFLGGLLIAVAVEEWNLHRRIAVGTMRVIGTHPAMLMLGLMLPTWFLSMWISNTAATAMMVPIIHAVVFTFREISERTNSEEGLDNPGYELESTDMDGRLPSTSPSMKSLTVSEPSTEASSADILRTSSTRIHRQTPEEFDRMAKGFAMAVAYAANMGGIATLTGTPPNLVLKQQADDLYSEWSGSRGTESPITFAIWMGFAFPLSLVGLALAWMWLCLFFLRKGTFRRLDPKTKLAVHETTLRQWKALGKITMAEIMVMIMFGLLVIFWLSRSPPGGGGWGSLFGNEDLKYVSDSTPAMLISVLMFILPAKVPEIFCLASDRENPKYTPLLTWKVAEKKVPWGVLVLLGGGFAIAKMSKDSGLSLWMGEQLTVFSTYEPWVMAFVISAIAAISTEVTSNTATTTLLLPIMSSLAITTGIHPLYLMISVTVACSFAFMLPVATPPNAIVFSTGFLTIPDMAVAGLPMNFIALLTLTLGLNSWGKAVFDLDTFPSVFKGTTIGPFNTTTTPAV